jgi:hypothetical protein
MTPFSDRLYLSPLALPIMLLNGSVIDAPVVARAKAIEYVGVVKLRFVCPVEIAPLASTYIKTGADPKMFIKSVGFPDATPSI